MNYQKIYNKIVEYRQNHIFDGYTETHHIMPKSLGGTDDNNNIVNLSAREHFICHWLLLRIYKEDSVEWRKMLKAFLMMALCSSSNQQRYITSRQFEKLRIKFAEMMSQEQEGEGNSQYNTCWIYSDKERKSIRVLKNSVDTYLVSGWKIGRIFDFDKRDKRVQEKLDKAKRQSEHNESLKSMYFEYYSLYKEVGFNKFVEITGWSKSHSWLIRAIKKHLNLSLDEKQTWQIRSHHTNEMKKQIGSSSTGRRHSAESRKLISEHHFSKRKLK